MARLSANRGHTAVGRDKFKAGNDRYVGVRAVPCPSCGAPAGEGCKSASGGRAQHSSRRVMALRAEREAG